MAPSHVIRPLGKMLSRSIFKVLHPKVRFSPNSGVLDMQTHVTRSSMFPYIPCFQARAKYCTSTTNGIGSILSTEDSYSTPQESWTRAETERDHGRLESFNIDTLVRLLQQENAADICVIKVPEEQNYCDYFIVVSGSSTRHLRAMALYAIKVHKFLKRDGAPHSKIEGRDTEDWMCIDFGGMVVHFMLPETRELYALEKLWTLRSFDEQLSSIPEEKLPVDFIYGAEISK